MVVAQPPFELQCVRFLPPFDFYKTMSSNTESNDFVNLRITQSEQEALRKAMEVKFSDPNRISYGGMVKLLSDTYIEEELN